MPTTYVEPTVKETNGPIGDSETTHPAYGSIGAFRTSGNVFLYGSDFAHHHFVTVRIAHSTLCRGLNYDRHHSGKEIVEVMMSEAQWATFVSAMNQGSGVPCTLSHIQGEQVPQIPSATDRRKQFAGEVKEDMEHVLENLDMLTRMIDGCKLSQTAKKELIGKVSHIASAIGPSLKFAADQFSEHMEKTVESAKIEVGAYVQQTINRAGLTTLGSPVALLKR